MAERERDDLVRDEEEAAAAEAASIGGGVPRGEEDLDPAMRPLYESGQGDAEGFEQAEQDLIDNASHGDGRGDPISDAFTPEAESDRSTAVYGEPDEEDTTELVRDPDEGDDSPAAGPGLAADR
jgi:hypothetical protein